MGGGSGGMAAAQAAPEAAQAAPEAAQGAQAAQAAQEARAEWAECGSAAWQQQRTWRSARPIEQEPDLTYFVYDEANRLRRLNGHARRAARGRHQHAHISHAGLLLPILDQTRVGARPPSSSPTARAARSFIASVLASQWLTVP
jgi:hypothetical protein